MTKKEASIIYTLLHFFVDFTTIFFISGVLLGPKTALVQRAYVIIIYNLVAFAGQLPIGILADYIRKNRLVAAMGCLLAGMAYLFAFFAPWLACVLASVGNGAFHIGAGSDILKLSMPKAGLSGLFVSSGAFGVWLAYKANGTIFCIICPIVMVVAFIYLFVTYKKEACETHTSLPPYNKPSAYVLLAVILLMMTIVIRSLLGSVMNFSWKAVPIYSFLFVLAVATGKATGGYLCDRFGFIKTATLSLTLAVILFAFSINVPVAGILAVFLFNMTMPLTLTAIASVSKQNFGFAFGLTTFALALGFIPTVFGASQLFGLPALLYGTLASLVLLVGGFYLLKKRLKG